MSLTSDLKNSYQYADPVVAATTRRPGRTNRTQMKLFEAAMEIMTTKGPTATTVEEVAQRAGVSKGTVYYNFGSKKTMVDQLLQYGARLLLQSMQAEQTQSDPREQLRQAIYTAFKYLSAHSGFARLWISEVWKEQENWSDSMLVIRGDILDFIEGMVRNLSERYTVDSAQDPKAIAIAIFGSTFMLSMDSEVHNSQRTPEDATRAVMLTVDGYITH